MQISFPQKSHFGVLTATEVRTPLVNNPAGSLVLQQQGVNAISCGTGVNHFHEDLRIGNLKSILDGGGNVLLDPDDAGHIAALARIDAPVTTPTASHSVFVTAGEIVSVKENAKIDESAGSWLVTANDVFYGWFGIVLGRLSLLGTVYIESIKIHLATGHIDDYIDEWTLDRRPLIDATRVAVANSTIDIGNGSTGYVNGTLTVNHEALVDSVYSLEVSCAAANVNLKIYGVEVKYHLV